MNIWNVSMECAGIIEAGGVKNVTYSLCKEVYELNHKSTLFIPLFKTTSYTFINDLKKNVYSAKINHCGKDESVQYHTAVFSDGGFNIVFVDHPCFNQKEGVYTYTENEHKANPEFIKGTGHKDELFMDSLFSKAVVKFLELIPKEDYPDIIHCQDASCALVPALLNKNQYMIKSVVTIHNAGPAYHHNFSSIGEAAWFTGLSEAVLSGALNEYRVEPFLLASNAGASLSTVSEHYAKELLDPYNNKETEGLSTVFFSRYTKITGITNGIDFVRYDPKDKSKSCLPFEFNPEKKDLFGKIKCRDYFYKNILGDKSLTEVPVFGSFDMNDDYTKQIYIIYHGRITEQKGISVLLSTIPHLINNFPNVRFLITGQGEITLENEILQLTKIHPGKVVFANGYSKLIARITNAIGDFIVLPSFFEPCGLEDLISQVYGTIPVANATGGLNKILNYQTGFLYTKNTTESLIAKLSEVISLKKYNPGLLEEMIQYAAIYVHKNYLWKNVVEQKYIPFFEEILKKK